MIKLSNDCFTTGNFLLFEIKVLISKFSKLELTDQKSWTQIKMRLSQN